MTGYMEIGPTSRAVCERVWKARRGPMVAGIRIEDFTICVARNLWVRMMIENKVPDDLRYAGTMFGLKIEADGGLDDDQIRLRYEVTA